MALQFLKTQATAQKQIPEKQENLKELEALLSNEEIYCLVQELKSRPAVKSMIWGFIKHHLK